MFQGASWQRCRVHFMRNVLSVVPKGSQDMVASIILTVFAQPDRKHIHTQFAEVTAMLARSHPKVAAMLDDAQHDLLAFAGFPHRHGRQIWSTNPLSVNRLSNDTFLSVVLMTRNQRLFGWKLLGTGRRKSSGYDRFSEEARGPIDGSRRYRPYSNI
jgi:transposase-like protein